MAHFFSGIHIHDDDDDASLTSIDAEKRKFSGSYAEAVKKSAPEKPNEIMQGSVNDFDLLYWYFVTKNNSDPVKIYGVQVEKSMFDDFVMNQNIHVLLDALGKIETGRQKAIAKPLELRLKGQVDTDDMSPEDKLSESPVRDITRKKLLKLYYKEQKKKKFKYRESDFPPNIRKTLEFVFEKALDVESVIVYTVEFTKSLFDTQNSDDDDVYVEGNKKIKELVDRANAVVQSTMSLMLVNDEGYYYYKEYDNEVLDSVLEALRFFYLTNQVKRERKRPLIKKSLVRYNMNKMALEDPDDDQATVLGDEDNDLDDEATVKGDEDLTDDEGDATTRDKFFARN